MSSTTAPTAESTTAASLASAQPQQDRREHPDRQRVLAVVDELRPRYNADNFHLHRAIQYVGNRTASMMLFFVRVLDSIRLRLISA